ncbi:MAG TPA: glycoside hydrolase, partial [Pedobacter sp.]
MIAELNSDLSGLNPNVRPKVLIEDASLVAGPGQGLPAEGSQMFKINGSYYLFNICWPKGGMRTVLVHRSDKLHGPYEGRIGLQDKGVAQGGLVQTTKGAWYAYMFRDFGAVGRIPYLVPVNWAEGWPVIGIAGKVPEKINLPAARGTLPGIVASDEFNKP